MKRSTAALILLHLVFNAALLYGGYLWLGMNEADNRHLLLSFGFASVLLLAGVVLHGTSFAYFDRHVARNLAQALMTAAGNLLPLTILVAAAIGIYWLLSYWRDHAYHRSFEIASWLTMIFRGPVAPAAIENGFFAIIAVLRWAVIPVLLLPLAARVANAAARRRTILYCVQMTLLLLCGVWLPLRLANWVPHFPSFAEQLVSIFFRFTVAYLLFIAASLVIAFITSGGRPRTTQPSTVGLP